MNDLTDFTPVLTQAVQQGLLLESSAANISTLLAGAASPIYEQSVRELALSGAWEELNDRFFRTLAFGTGGLRGRTIGNVVTEAETGTPTALGRPEHPCVGTNAMNHFNVSRAAQGLVAYLHEWFASQQRSGKPKIVIAYDPRHFSRDFAALTAKVASELGCDAALFESPRSTPELSFAVRATNATAGIVITASHNPPHDNGFKCYFEDGAQVVEPHASAIIAKVNAIQSDIYEPLEKARQGSVQALGHEMDNAYMQRLETLVLDREMVAAANDLKIVYTPIHGTGGVIIKPMLKRLGFRNTTVPEQDAFDGRFPTVKSPNPENADALKLAIELANREHADLVIATDPDADRMGIAARDANGEIQLFTGNQIGSLMAFYRAKKLIEQGVITPENASRATIVKTFVTTDLQKAIAEKFGMHCVETLTGFKYIGEKLRKYEEALPEESRANYRQLSEKETRALRLAKSHYYVFGGEESYGYSGADFVRDKDANGAAVMFAEVAAYAKSRKITLSELLDEIFAEFGFYLERNASLTFEGAEGAAKIRTLAASYVTNSPKIVDGSEVVKMTDFNGDPIFDSEGDQLPREKMLIVDLADGRRFAVRPSGTEPKIKFYMYVRQPAQNGARLAVSEIGAIKEKANREIDHLWNWLKEDANSRLAGK